MITATDAPEALAVIEKTARQNNATLTVVSPAEMKRAPLDNIHLPLLGQHQRMNAAVAIAAVRALTSEIPVPEETIRTGLGGVQWPGRLQLVT